MQTYTHAVTGAALGIAVFPDNLYAQGACVIGSVAPDIVMVPQFLWDRFVAKRQAMADQGPWLMILKELSHSLPLWLVFTLVATQLPYAFAPIGVALGLSGAVHVIVDIFTHGKPRKSDPTNMWPIPYHVWIGTWDYRKEEGNLSPKPFEGLVILGSITATAILWLMV